VGVGVGLLVVEVGVGVGAIGVVSGGMQRTPLSQELQ
jgi:hypothetical protein